MSLGLADHSSRELLTDILPIASEVAETYWLRVWSNTYDVEGGKANPHRDVNFYLGIYAALTVLTILIDTLRKPNLPKFAIALLILSHRMAYPLHRWYSSQYSNVPRYVKPVTSS